jgi:hypothetical protein
MTLTPTRTAKLPASAEMALAGGDHIALTTTSPDRTYVLDLRAWPLAGRVVPGLFASSMARTASGRVLAVARHGHPNPYRLYELDLASGAVKPLALGAPWHEPLSVFALGDRVLVTPGGTLRTNGHRPAWWRDGELTPLDLALPDLPTPVTHAGKTYVMPDRMDRVDAFALPDGDALVIWYERLHRVSGEGVTPLALDHLFAAWEPLREGRHAGSDDRGRALSVVSDRLLAIDREGAYELAAPGVPRTTAAVQGPDGVWLLAAEESLYAVFTREREVVEVDLRPMRLAPKMPLFMPKPVWVPSRDAVLVAHSHDVWEFDLAALRREKRVGFDRLAQKHAAAQKSLWSRKVKGAGDAPLALDALSQHTRGGNTPVKHPTYGVGAVTHASETIRGGAQTITATVLFEDRTRTFVFMGDRWDERPWAF